MKIKKTPIIKVKPLFKTGLETEKIQGVPEDVIDDMENIKEIHKEKPETYSEMQQAIEDVKWYNKMLKKYPQLKKHGFDEDDVYDPRGDF